MACIGHHTGSSSPHYRPARILSRDHRDYRNATTPFSIHTNPLHCLQSLGWEHYEVHEPEPHILLFKSVTYHLLPYSSISVCLANAMLVPATWLWIHSLLTLTRHRWLTLKGQAPS